MKKFKQNPLLNVELKATPLTQDAEGKLLGGFVGMQGAKAPSEINIDCSNINCTNVSCVNMGCSNNECVNWPCEKIVTATDTTTATNTQGFLFF